LRGGDILQVPAARPLDTFWELSCRPKFACRFSPHSSIRLAVLAVVIRIILHIRFVDDRLTGAGEIILSAALEDLTLIICEVECVSIITCSILYVDDHSVVTMSCSPW